MRGASHLHGLPPATGFLHGLEQVTWLPQASISCRCKIWGISSLHRGVGERRGKGDGVGALRFLRFVPQGQSSRDLGLFWKQKWKLPVPLELFKNLVLSKISPSPKRTLQLNSTTMTCIKASLVFLLLLFGNTNLLCWCFFFLILFQN